MTYFNTIIKAIDPEDGKLKEWVGPTVKAETFEDAQLYCKENLGYCKPHRNLTIIKDGH